MNGKIGVRFEQAGLQKLCVSNVVNPWLDDDFVISSGERTARLDRAPTLLSLVACIPAVSEGRITHGFPCQSR